MNWENRWQSDRQLHWWGSSIEITDAVADSVDHIAGSKGLFTLDDNDRAFSLFQPSFVKFVQLAQIDKTSRARHRLYNGLSGRVSDLNNPRVWVNPHQSLFNVYYFLLF